MECLECPAWCYAPRVWAMAIEDPPEELEFPTDSEAEVDCDFEDLADETETLSEDLPIEESFQL